MLTCFLAPLRECLEPLSQQHPGWTQEQGVAAVVRQSDSTPGVSSEPEHDWGRGWISSLETVFLKLLGTRYFTYPQSITKDFVLCSTRANLVLEKRKYVVDPNHAANPSGVWAQGQSRLHRSSHLTESFQETSRHMTPAPS